ncbi:hypothetical protein [Variovorax sp. DXTD-1]|uniref:hypothetical protein n=1 Tax=Variovorax sp. DXTD-1 TaxID=2495592 RepID=UPI000F878700|nr:hypothetical protein [Variovorax sp. DXTD-1]
MARKQRKSPSIAAPAARGMAPARAADSHVAAPRVLEVPAHVLEALARDGAVEGVPDLVATRLLLGGLAALLALMALSFGAAVVLQDDWSNLHGNEGVVALAVLGLLAGLGGGLWYLLRQFAHVGQGSIRIDADGMRWGHPASPQALAWREVCRVRTGLQDVKTEFTSSDAIVKRLVFQRAAGGGETMDVRLPLALTMDAPRVLRSRRAPACAAAEARHPAPAPAAPSLCRRGVHRRRYRSPNLGAHAGAKAVDVAFDPCRAAAGAGRVSVLAAGRTGRLDDCGPCPGDAGRRRCHGLVHGPALSRFARCVRVRNTRRPRALRLHRYRLQ